MSFTRRTLALLAVAAVSALLVPWQVSALAMVAVVVAAAADAWQVREPPEVVRVAPSSLSRGVPGVLDLRVASGPRRTLVKQPVTDADLRVGPSAVGLDRVEAAVVASRRGSHELPAPATISSGPLGLGRWYHRPGAASTITVYPDLPAARRLAMDVRLGRFREEGRRSRGPLGLGTDLETIREYLPDDDIRQVNWKATARMGTPMSNTFRVEQDRRVLCLVDCGRLMAAPVTAPDGVTRITRLDVAVDVVAAVTAVAGEVGDQIGVLAFTDRVVRTIDPRRDGERAVLEAIHDLEPVGIESNYELAFQHAISLKRSLVVVLTDLLDEAAAEPLLRALPILARTHHVVVSSLIDPDVHRLITTPAEDVRGALETAVAVEILAPRSLVVARLRHRGVDVVEGEVADLSARTVGAYLRAKRRARA